MQQNTPHQGFWPKGSSGSETAISSLDPCREEEEFSLDRSGRFLEPDVLPDGGVRSCADPSAAGRGAAERFRLRIPQQGVSDNLIPAYFVTWFPLV
jgi:hypothetical protein